MGVPPPDGAMKPHVPYPELEPHLPVSKPEDVISELMLFTAM